MNNIRVSTYLMLTLLMCSCSTHRNSLTVSQPLAVGQHVNVVVEDENGQVVSYGYQPSEHIVTVDVGSVTTWTLLENAGNWALQAADGAQLPVFHGIFVGAGPSSKPHDMGDKVCLSSDLSDFVKGTKYYRIEIQVKRGEQISTSVVWTKVDSQNEKESQQ